MFYNTFEGFFWLFLMTDFACFYEQPTNILEDLRDHDRLCEAAFVELHVTHLLVEMSLSIWLGLDLKRYQVKQQELSLNASLTEALKQAQVVRFRVAFQYLSQI